MAELVLLCHTSAKPNQVANWLRSGKTPVSWVFLGQDYLGLLEMQSAIGSLADQVQIGEDLNQVAAKLRGPFLDLITSLGRDHNSLAWWASRLSERNTMVSPLFLYCCYVRLAQDAIDRTPGTLCVISESWEVLEFLAEYAQPKTEVVWRTPRIPVRRKIYFFARTAVRLFRFVANSIAQSLCSSRSSLSRTGPRNILLRTWVDETCLGNDGRFHDRYLPGLSEWLTKQGYNVVTIPVWFNLNRSYKDAWKWLRQNNQQFLNPFSYYGLGDYLFVMRHALRQLTLTNLDAELSGIKVGRLLRAEQKRAFCDDTCLASMLSYRLPKHLAAQGHRIDVLIDLFENMIAEKSFNLGFRRYLPDTKIVGFQHGALFPLLLCIFVTRGEAEFAPIPDRIVCNGWAFRDILVREGLPADRTIVGPALRYAHLWRLMSAGSSNGHNRSGILVPLPLVLDSAVELLTKVLSALDPLENVRIKFKVHPMSTPRLVLAAAKRHELPSNAEFVQGGMETLLRECELVIALSTSTVHEALAAGVPVIVVGRETALDLNPLAWSGDLGVVVRHPDKLREQVLRLLNLTNRDLDDYRVKASEALHSCFSPVTEDGLQAFLSNLQGKPTLVQSSEISMSATK
jgi:hypothetical protein